MLRAWERGRLGRLGACRNWCLDHGIACGHVTRLGARPSRTAGSTGVLLAAGREARPPTCLSWGRGHLGRAYGPVLRLPSLEEALGHGPPDSCQPLGAARARVRQRSEPGCRRLETFG